MHVVISEWYPFVYQPILRRAPEAFLIGERDYAGCMRFRKFRQFLRGAGFVFEGGILPQVPSWVMKGGWPGDLRQDVEGRMSDTFCGKMTRQG